MTKRNIMTENLKEEIAKEVGKVFNKICMEEVMEKTKHLLVSPKCMQNKIADLIDG